RARRRDVREIAAGARRRLEVLAGEDGGQAVRAAVVLEGEADAGARHAGGAAADRVDDEERRPLLLVHVVVDVLGGEQLADPAGGELVAHRLDQQWAIGHGKPPSDVSTGGAAGDPDRSVPSYANLGRPAPWPAEIPDSAVSSWYHSSIMATALSPARTIRVA